MTGTTAPRTTSAALTWTLVSTRRDADWEPPGPEDGALQSGAAYVVEFQAQDRARALIAYAYAAWEEGGDPGKCTVRVTFERIAGTDAADPVGTESWSASVTVEVPGRYLGPSDADAYARYVAFLLADGAWPALALVSPEVMAALQDWDGETAPGA